MPNLIPRQAVPELSATLLSGETWSLADEKPEKFTLVVFYRGIFCPICRNYLRDLERQLLDFSVLGINVIALSADTKEGAKRSKEEWKLQNLRVAYGLDLKTAADWGLFISKGREGELEYFSEPGVFLVRTDGTLYFSTVQTMPFARPLFSEIVKASKYLIDTEYPARGEVVDYN